MKYPKLIIASSISSIIILMFGIFGLLIAWATMDAQLYAFCLYGGVIVAMAFLTIVLFCFFVDLISLLKKGI